MAAGDGKKKASPFTAKLTELPPDMVITKSGRTVGELLEERRENARKGADARAGRFRGKKGEEPVREMIKAAIRQKGGRSWLLSLDDKQFASLALRVVEKDIETDQQRMSHEEWLDYLDSGAKEG